MKRISYVYKKKEAEHVRPLFSLWNHFLPLLVDLSDIDRKNADMKRKLMTRAV